MIISQVQILEHTDLLTARSSHRINQLNGAES